MKLSSPLLSFKALRESTSGAIMMEFALLAPLLISLLVGSNEVARMVRASQHLEDYATMVANDVSTAASTLTAGTLRELIERIGLVAPELVDSTLPAWDTSVLNSSYLGVGISMAMSTVTNSACRTGCTFSTDLYWTFGNNQRSCGAVSLPAHVKIPGPVVIVDVRSTYKFAFDFAGVVGAAPTLSGTVYMPVKNWQDAGLIPTPSPKLSGAWALTSCH